MYLRIVALTGLIAACLPHATAAESDAVATASADAAQSDPYARVFALVPEAAYPQLSTRAGGADIRRVQPVRDGKEPLILLELRRGLLPTLRTAVRSVFPHGGVMTFGSRDEALAHSKATPRASAPGVAPYTIDQPYVVAQWLSGVSEPKMRETISYLESSFTTRHPPTAGGKNAALGIKARWEALAAGRSDVKVELVECSSCAGQPSVVMTLKGQSSETVVVGAHLDTSAGVGGRSPGANENASGIAVLTETIRIALSSQWMPKRDVVFVAYAAQTTGLNGSRALAQNFKSQGKVVTAVLDLDYTNYRASGAAAMRQISDGTNTGLNQFVQQLGARYVPTAPMVATACGYSCGDHSSWTSAGFPAAALTGSTWLASNGTERDTLAALGNTAEPSVPFAKMALAFVAETAKGEIPDAPPPPTAKFSYKLDGLTVRFTDESEEGAGRITHWDWRFGDGTTSTERHPVHTYAQAGRYTVTLRVLGEYGGADDQVSEVVVEGAPVDGVLENGKAVEGLAGATGSQRYWTMAVPAGATYLKFVSSGGAGDVDLYVKRGAKPTAISYDCRPYRIGNEEVCELDDSEGGTYHVMLRGYKAYSGVSLVGKYRLLPDRKTYANESDMSVPDQGAAIESAIVVTGREGNALEEARVQVDIKHSYIGDLVVELLAEDGTVYVLHNRSGGSADNLSATYTVNLSAKPLNGTWKLRVRDLSRGDVGELDRWSLTF